MKNVGKQTGKAGERKRVPGCLHASALSQPSAAHADPSWKSPKVFVLLSVVGTLLQARC